MSEALPGLTAAKQAESEELSEVQALSDFCPVSETLYNTRPPSVRLQKEHQWHRLAITLAARGVSNREISGLVGRTEAQVSQVLRQPWARKLLVETINQQGKDAFRDLLERELAPSVNKLIELRDGADREETQLRAAVELIDRARGKAVQHVDVQKKQISLTMADLRKMEQELESLKQQEVALRGSGECETVDI